MIHLGVNIDHVATLRQARKGCEPDPVWAAAAAQLGGADGITIHLREDRRHIQDRDLAVLKETVNIKLNLECACVPEMLDIATTHKPEQVCLVPERREEVTTEGGLDVIGQGSAVKDATQQIQAAGIQVSLFIDPTNQAIDAAEELGADRVELHTGAYANAQGLAKHQELERLRSAARRVLNTSLVLDAGHGLNYHNVVPISQLDGLDELNIGHSIVSRSVLIGMENAVRQMKRLINGQN